nr:hypothetical protein [Tanacetum cinerariifolium]
SQELKTVSYHKLYDILKQHQNEVNEIRAKRIARNANPLELVSQQQPVYHLQNHPTHYTQNSSTISQQAATRNRGKAIVNSPQPIYDQEPSMVAENDETSKDKEIDKLMALISLSFKKIYKPTNNNLRTSSNTSRLNQDNSLRINRSTGHVTRECQKLKRVKDAAYHREKMLLYQELEVHYMYMAQLQEVSPDAADSGPIFDAEPLQKYDFSSNSPDYTSASPDYFSASPGNTSSNSSNNSYGLVPIASPTLLLFHDDAYMKVMHAYDTIMPPQVPIPLPIIVPPSLMLSPIFNPQEFFVPKEISPPKDAETPIESSILVSPSSSVGSSLPVRSITPPPDYPFDESIFAELYNSLWNIPQPLGSKPVPKEPNESDAHLWK